MIIDVSFANGKIDWDKIGKNEVVEMAIIRVGYRGYREPGKLMLDKQFKANTRGAEKAEVKRHFYFMSQAVTEKEAKEEAEYCVAWLTSYVQFKDRGNTIIFIDSEYANKFHNGRADGLSVTARSRIIEVFCETVKSRGYLSGVYASKDWFLKKLSFNIVHRIVDSIDYLWCAQYNERLTLGHPVDLWQYSSRGMVSGIDGNVDCNRLTMGSKLRLDVERTQVKTPLYWVTVGDVMTEEEARKHAENVKRLYPQLAVGIRKGTIETVEVLD